MKEAAAKEAAAREAEAAEAERLKNLSNGPNPNNDS